MGLPVGRTKIAVYALSGLLLGARRPAVHLLHPVRATASARSAWSSTPSPRSSSAARCSPAASGYVLGSLLGRAGARPDPDASSSSRAPSAPGGPRSSSAPCCWSSSCCSASSSGARVSVAVHHSRPSLRSRVDPRKESSKWQTHPTRKRWTPRAPRSTPVRPRWASNWVPPGSRPSHRPRWVGRGHGGHEWSNQFVDGLWTYDLEASGRACRTATPSSRPTSRAGTECR